MMIGKKHGFKMKETECVILGNIGKTILRAEKKFYLSGFFRRCKKNKFQKVF